MSETKQAANSIIPTIREHVNHFGELHLDAEQVATLIRYIAQAELMLEQAEQFIKSLKSEIDSQLQ